MDPPLLHQTHSNLEPRTPNSHPSSFLHHNGNSDIPSSPKLEISDIEMITLQSVSYISLRDLLPSSPPPSVMSPTNNSSWYEIPIKNPLVKQAALAYLQPMSTPLEPGDRGILGRLRDACGCSDNGCLCWMTDAVVRLIAGVFGNGEEEDDDEDEEKVD